MPDLLFFRKSNILLMIFCTIMFSCDFDSDLSKVKSWNVFGKNKLPNNKNRSWTPYRRNDDDMTEHSKKMLQLHDDSLKYYGEERYYLLNKFNNLCLDVSSIYKDGKVFVSVKYLSCYWMKDVLKEDDYETANEIQFMSRTELNKYLVKELSINFENIQGFTEYSILIKKEDWVLNWGMNGFDEFSYEINEIIPKASYTSFYRISWTWKNG